MERDAIRDQPALHKAQRAGSGIERTYSCDQRYPASRSRQEMFSHDRRCFSGTNGGRSVACGATEQGWTPRGHYQAHGSIGKEEEGICRVWSQVQDQGPKRRWGYV